ncbi:MAG: hypothetical protein DA405_00735 [Bacteroidetes bacterium]|nr:MAG: hypothetical protein DA405_00735 [Bacteroidota bacterium]
MAYFQGGAASNLKNVVLPKGGEYVIHKTTYVPQLAKPKNPLYWQSLDDYWQDLDLHPEKLHYNYPLINNQCYYSKCSFCVQIRKHMSVKSFEEQDAMDRSIAHLLYLRDRHGLKYFSFMDEALRPKDLKTLVNHQEFRKAGFLWNMRLIADANFKEDLIEDLYSAGCREALFGLETIQEDTAMDMVKVSQRSELKHIVTLIFKFSNRGIRLILSMIYNFPTAPKDEDKVLMDFARKLTHLNNGVDFIFNQFSLFGNTPVFENRQDYGIQKIYDPGAQEDLYNVYSYEAQERGCSIDDKRDFNYKLIQLDLKEKDYTRSDFANLYPRLNDAHALYYSSWGFIYRVKHQAGLYQELKNQILDAGYD